MRKIILDLAVTLDGYIEGPNGEIDWITSDAQTDFADIIRDILVGIDTIFYGRVSYELWGNYRPDEKAGTKLKEAYELLHSKKKYVFSTTMADDDKATIIRSDVREKVLEILKEPGENIWLYGGGKLTTTFINLGLIDIYRLAVYPVILGSGKPLFENIETRTNLKLIDAKPADDGVLLLKYETRR
jgi:dihydrofolate reductase